MCIISALDLKNAPGSIYEGPPQGDKAGCTLTLSDDDFMGFVSGSLNPQKVHIYTNQPLLSRNHYSSFFEFMMMYIPDLQITLALYHQINLAL